jgi:hypothetical protein
VIRPAFISLEATSTSRNQPTREVLVNVDKIVYMTQLQPSGSRIKYEGGDFEVTDNLSGIRAKLEGIDGQIV